MDDLPVEIKEIIISFCCGEALFNLRKVNHKWKNLVNLQDKRKNLFKRCLKQEVDKDELRDLVSKMYPKRKCLHTYPVLYKTIFHAHLKWKYFSNNSNFLLEKVPIVFRDIIDLMSSGDTILVGDKDGLYIVNSLNKSTYFYHIERIKNIELCCPSSKIEDKYFWHDKADITTENNVHHFFNFKKMEFEKHSKVYEKKDIKYCGEKSVRLDMNRPRKNPLVKADLFRNSIMIATDKNVILSKKPGVLKCSKVEFDGEGARTWCLWHSKLTICAKDESLNIYVDGKTRTISYYDFPPITAILFYSGWLFFGSKYGSLYGYQLKVENIISLELEKYDYKLDICTSAIVKIDVIERKKTYLLAASEKELFFISSVKE